MEKKKLPQEFEISELFLVKAGNDYKNTFIGQVYQETTKEGISIVRGSVEVTDGKLWSVAESHEELGKFLDDLCMLKLDMGLHLHASNLNSTELRGKLLKLKESTNKALVMSGGVKLLELGFFIRRMDNFLMDLMIDQEKLSEMLDILVDMHLAGLEKKCQTVGDIVDVIRFGDDLGMTSGPFMDMVTFRKLFKPRYKILCDYVKKHSNMKIFLHSCGSIKQFIPDLIEAGFDIINPVQTNCYQMDLLTLKNEFGRDITFWGGGIDTASVINRATPKKVRKDVLTRCEILSKDGGFIFAPIHNILSEVPPQNVTAIYNAVKEFNGDAI